MCLTVLALGLAACKEPSLPDAPQRSAEETLLESVWPDGLPPDTTWPNNAPVGGTQTSGTHSWGTMREVLRGGRSEGRVPLASLPAAKMIGVGALAGLAGEVTILDGRILTASARAASSKRPPVRPAQPGDKASLLVVAQVPAWDEIPLGKISDYTALERHLAAALTARGLDLDTPQPVRVRGRASRLAVHVIAGACPIAQPNGPKPWRYDNGPVDVELVGFYVENAAGRFTHHNRRSHLHAVAAKLMGHLDEVSLEDAVLLLPRARGRR